MTTTKNMTAKRIAQAWGCDHTAIIYGLKTLSEEVITNHTPDSTRPDSTERN